jgi:hypothetical protein
MDSKSSDLLADSFSERELAEQLHKDERTVMRWRKLRIGPPFFLVGKTPYYPVESARGWLRSRVQLGRRRRG